MRGGGGGLPWISAVRWPDACPLRVIPGPTRDEGAIVSATAFSRTIRGRGDMQKSRKRPTAWRTLVLATLAVGLYAAATIAPAGAGAHSAHSLAALGASRRSSTGSTRSTASTSRGSEARVPTLNQVVQDLSASAKGKGGKSFGAAVPVYFHVVHADGVGNISQRIIDEQIASQRRVRGVLRWRGNGILVQARRRH